MLASDCVLIKNTSYVEHFIIHVSVLQGSPALTVENREIDERLHFLCKKAICLLSRWAKKR